MTERLWAPWRAGYITAAASRTARKSAGKKGSTKAAACIFCALPAEKRDRANLIIRRARRTFVMLNKFPYNNGHLLVAPYAHVAQLDDLSGPALQELSEEVRDAARRLREAMKPDGLNIGINIGRVAGAGFADHVHYHIVPRWNGDTNFMSAVNNVRIISQGLEATRKALEPAFRKKSRGKSKPRDRRS